MSGSGGNVYVAIALAAVVSLLLRALPIVLLSRLKMPQVLRDWLAFIPAAIMAAMVAAELTLKPEWTPSGLSVSLMAALVATLCGALTRSLFVTVISGVLAFLGFQWWLG